MRGLISVYDKTGIVEFGKFLAERGVTIYSTGGTFKMLKSNIESEKIESISTLTEFPEILDGRVKTLHPKIHGGILAKRDNVCHKDEMNKLGIKPFNIIVVNLYPFSKVLESNPNNEDLILENIDIGGHTLIRSSAKNYRDVLIVTDPQDYAFIMNKWTTLTSDNPEESIDLRREFAKKAFHHITRYDSAISSYFNNDIIYKSYKKVRQLKYGINPQQKDAGIYTDITLDTNKMIPFQILNGNPGYVNMLDAIYGWNLVCDLAEALKFVKGDIGYKFVVVASYKHNSPAGVGVNFPLTDTEKQAFFVRNGDKSKEMNPLSIAFIRARNVDPMSSFGDFIAISDIVNEETAKLIKLEYSDGIVAKGYTDKALEILKRKKRGQYVILVGDDKLRHSKTEIRDMHGLALIQDENMKTTDYMSFDKIVTDKKDMTDDVKRDLIIANVTLKYTQSNSVCSAKHGQVLGVGAGQQSRIDCVKLVKRKTNYWYLRQHPKCLDLINKFKKGVKRTDKINAIIRYIEDDFTDLEFKEWSKLFEEQPTKLTDTEKQSYLESIDDICLASDAFFPFRDNIDVSSQFGVKYIIQPGGSIRDDIVIDACNKYGMAMALTGRDSRMFLH